MVQINIQPKEFQNGDKITFYTNTVGTVQETFTFSTAQETVILKNKGTKTINYTIDSTSGVLSPSESVKVTGSISSLLLSSSGGTQEFEIWADEIGAIGIPSVIFVPNVKSLWEYSGYATNTDVTTLINQALSELAALGGGKLRLPMGTIFISSTITIPSNIQVEGFGEGMSIVKLANGVSVDMITLDTNDNCGISYLTIQGNAYSVPGASQKDGLVLGRSGINTSINEGNMPNLNIHNIEIRDIVGNGFHCYPGTWIYYISKMQIRYCTNYGMWIASTDNMYDTVELTANGSHGLYVSGSNNRLSNMKIIFNGRGALSGGKFYGTGDNLTSAGVRIVGGTRNTLVNIESQENYGHGFVFDGTKDADLLGLLADKNGYSALAPDGTSVTGTPSAIGFYFMNSAARLTGMVKATNFNSDLVSQPTGYYIDSSCSNISLEYEQDATQTGQSVNLSYTSLVTTADVRATALANSQYNDLLTSGLTLVNVITAYNTSNFSLGTSFVNAGYTIAGNDIYGTTNWAGSPRIGTPGNQAITKDSLYLVRVKVKPDTNNYYLRLKAMYNDGAFESITTLGGNYTNSAYTEISFVIKAPRAGNLLVFVEDKVGANNASAQPFHISELAIVEISSVINAKYHPKTVDQLVKKNYFLGSRAFV